MSTTTNLHIVDGAFQPDTYSFAEDFDASKDHVIYPLSVLKEVDLQAAGKNIGVRLLPEDDVTEVRDLLANVALVECLFPIFTDGRGYSHARLMRDEYRYQGAIRASGDVGRDQLHYLTSVGFNWFLLRENEDEATVLDGFQTFSVDYRDPTTRAS